MAAAAYRFKRIRDELRTLLGDDSQEQRRWRDDELDALIGEAGEMNVQPYTFNQKMPGWYRCSFFGGDEVDAWWLLMAEEDKTAPAPFTGTADCVYEISCRGVIRVRSGTEAATSLTVSGCAISWGLVYDRALAMLEGRKTLQSQVQSGDGSFTPTEESRIRNFREYRKGAR